MEVEVILSFSLHVAFMDISEDYVFPFLLFIQPCYPCSVLCIFADNCLFFLSGEAHTII